VVACHVAQLGAGDHVVLLRQCQQFASHRAIFRSAEAWLCAATRYVGDVVGPWRCGRIQDVPSPGWGWVKSTAQTHNDLAVMAGSTV
jgi:hypothetical protein